MAAIPVSVTTAESMSTSEDNAFLDITFTVTNGFSYAANSNIYYYAHLTDSTSGTAKTQDVTFSVFMTNAGAIEDDATQTFTFENTGALVPTITATGGRICYLPQ